jgi:hypothetical protein
MGKFSTEAAPATDQQKELLMILMEEGAEVQELLNVNLVIQVSAAITKVQQRASKAGRFGPSEIQPGQKLDNTKRLSVEIGDMYAAISMLAAVGLVDFDTVEEAMDSKIQNLPNWLQANKA